MEVEMEIKMEIKMEMEMEVEMEMETEGETSPLSGVGCHGIPMPRNSDATSRSFCRLAMTGDRGSEGTASPEPADWTKCDRVRACPAFGASDRIGG